MRVIAFAAAALAFAMPISAGVCAAFGVCSQNGIIKDCTSGSCVGKVGESCTQSLAGPVLCPV
ncbi:hypothetical protein CABS01_00898 [Colletotrichum abscissum]|uniref:Uncharacterized protein n=1 Tax=Colletotrichum costaricense TaxID=1209916 RepID=A0AAI9YV40_9PEZI|nr:uncharacterized protein CCOS01_08264 [Colletotrichum costaricense]XP_060401357.1 uncharacterized protein CABS01_00898 [Colletotrichum abscissum]KAK1505430.1 hypothetical protein CABS01_00898 [Colletotrichum abscissum]KAK1525846.1 hypothetical protein CCOS01_08264 [Colletotrichum costaricense]